MKTHTIRKCLDAEIEYQVFDNEHYELTLNDYLHIQGLIMDGYVKGKLVTNDGRGYWKLIK